MIPKRKDFHTQYKLYWDWYWGKYKADRHLYYMPDTQGRKLKRNIFYPHEYSYYSRTPKYHNKLCHIRPKRRETRLLERQIIVSLNPEEAEIKYYVNHKEHIYWS